MVVRIFNISDLLTDFSVFKTILLPIMHNIICRHNVMQHISRTYSSCITKIFFFFFFNLWLRWVFVSVRGLPPGAASGATLHRSARASHHRGLPRCGAQAPDAQAQQLWLTGPVAPRHVGSSQTRARTRVPCIGRQTLNHCATGEAQHN